jgi:hypothetical protein
LLLCLWLHIALHKITEELLYPDWGWFLDDCWRICYIVWWIAQLGKQLSHVRWYFNLKYLRWRVVLLVISSFDWHISGSQSQCVGCKIVAGEYVASYQNGKCHKVKCFKIEYFQVGVQILMHVSCQPSHYQILDA